MPSTDGETPGTDPAQARVRAGRTKAGVAVASVTVFLVAIPAVQGTVRSHARTTHALVAPPQLVDALSRGGFTPGDLAPAQGAPAVQSSGS